MSRTAAAVVIIPILASLMSGGCTNSAKYARTQSEAEMFAAVSMRIHPIFTQVKDWTGDGIVDGVEALLEFQDQFTDPTKAAGDVVFELYAYQPYSPDARGERVLNPWLGSLRTLGDQEARWNRTSRTYSFELEYPEIRDDRDYVLVATFDTGQTRFFDQIVLEGRRTPRGEQRVPATRPADPIPHDSDELTQP